MLESCQAISSKAEVDLAMIYRAGVAWPKFRGPVREETVFARASRTSKQDCNSTYLSIMDKRELYQVHSRLRVQG
jgi:hypothetical protein